MPIVKLYCERHLTGPIGERSEPLMAELTEVLVASLGATPDLCEIIVISATRQSPIPIYVDLQFRAHPCRGSEQVEAAMAGLASVLGATLDVAVRVRAFAIDPGSLHGLEYDPDQHR